MRKSLNLEEEKPKYEFPANQASSRRVVHKIYTQMPRKKRAALASAENGKKYIEELERPKKRVRFNMTPTTIASAGEKEVC